jgi:hypothetical protein
LAKGPLAKWSSAKIVITPLRLEKTDKFSAVKIINKLQLKKKPFLKKYIDQEI